MEIAFTLSNGLPLAASTRCHQKQLHAQNDLTVSTCRFSSTSVDVLVQELTTRVGRYRSTTVTWHHPEKLIIKYHLEPSVHIRICLEGKLHEFIKGAGEVHLSPGEFSSTLGSRWFSLFYPHAAGSYSFLEIIVAGNVLQKKSSSYPDIISQLQDGAIYPFRLHTNALRADPYIKTQIEMMKLTSEQAPAEKHQLFTRELKRLYSSILQETETLNSIRTRLRSDDWLKILKAQQYVLQQAVKQITTSEVSKAAGINEFKLKQLFPKVFGYTLDEYRKYKLCTRIGKKIVEDDALPIKSIYLEAGYSNLPNFIRGFRKLCCCAPGELRKDTWSFVKSA